MKTNKLSFLIAVNIFLISCIKERISIIDIKQPNVTITGNYMNGFAKDNTKAINVEQIPNGDSIIFYSTGGVEADGDILKYDNSQWKGTTDYKWNFDNEKAFYCAYYPIIRESESLYYENGELKDIVFCKDSTVLGESIRLTFNHIFAKFVINMEERINNSIKRIHINIPHKVNGIDLKTGDYTTSEGNYEYIIFEKNENCKYEFILPASKSMALSIKLEFSNGISKVISTKNYSFQSGYEYLCNIKKDTSENGIYTTDDFIAFTHLINGATEYEGKKLEYFYTVKDGKRIFNLYNDLNFTDEEAEKVAVIKEFNDTFDGNNYSISNLNANKDGDVYFALWLEVTENGCLKNIILDNCKCSIPKDKYTNHGSIFVGRNNGFIDNCHIKNGVINMENGKRYGGLVCLNSSTGTIVNSSISNLQLESNDGWIGLFVYQNDGNIFNCRIISNINKNTTSKYSSCICAHNNMILYNIFVSEYISGYYGVCYKNEGIFKRCIIPEEYKKNNIICEHNYNPDSCTHTPFYDLEGQKESIANFLNSWIEENQSNYPNITFRKWTTDPTDKVIFE